MEPATRASDSEGGGADAPGGYARSTQRSVGELAEHLAAAYLEAAGLQVWRTNQRVGKGELDIIGHDRGEPVAVEVRARKGSLYPLEAIGEAKRRQVRFLASQIGIARCDLVGIGLHDSFFVVHWERRAF